MIVDDHTHLSTREQWGPVFCEVVDQTYDGSGMDLNCTDERHQAAMSAVDRAIVFGINSKALQMWVADPHSRSLTLHPQHPHGVGQPASL